MEIVGDRKYVEIPGRRVHELPPLLLKDVRGIGDLNDVVGRAESIVENDSLLAGDLADEYGKVGLAINLAEQYSLFLTHWAWGESILEWIRQCEITFESRPNLKPLLSPDVWPHAGRKSFVTLLEDKAVPHTGVDLEDAMGYRLTFRQPPPIQFFSDKFLFFLRSSIAANAFQTWAEATAEEPASLPPERFRFFVTGTEIKEV